MESPKKYLVRRNDRQYLTRLSHTGPASWTTNKELSYCYTDREQAEQLASRHDAEVVEYIKVVTDDDWIQQPNGDQIVNLTAELRARMAFDPATTEELELDCIGSFDLTAYNAGDIYNVFLEELEHGEWTELDVEKHQFGVLAATHAVNDLIQNNGY